MMRIDHSNSRWRIDKRVPVAVIIAMILQIAGILVWATQLDARVGGVEQQLQGESLLLEKFARLEERLEFLKRDVEGIGRKIDTMQERSQK
jgi:hypothetical protein